MDKKIVGNEKLTRRVRTSCRYQALLPVFAFFVVSSAPSIARADAPPYGLTDFPYGSVYQLTHTADGAVDLSDFQVQVKVDTATEIAAGRMKTDCSDLRAYLGDGCAPVTGVNFWVADGTCNTASTNVWLGLPAIKANTTTSFTLYWGNSLATSSANGPAVFPIFFDDFNGAAVDTSKWNQFGASHQSQANGILTSSFASAIWTVDATVMKAGETVFGVRTNAQSASGADIEYGAATLLSGTGGGVHWSNRSWTGVTWMSWDYAAAFIGKGASGLGSCAVSTNVGSRWANSPGDPTWFQTEFFYEMVPAGGSQFGIYDKFGAKRDITSGNSSCSPPTSNSAYWQWDHSDVSPNPISSLDYTYIRKYAKPDPVGVPTGTKLRVACGVPNGQGSCTAANAGVICQSGACSPTSDKCIPASSGSCWLDADCAGGHFCNQSTFTCTDPLTVGTLLPADGLHDTCPGSHVSAACVTGLCNVQTNTCADVNGASCSGASGCVANVCDVDSKCAYGSGHGACTNATKAMVCRSGGCSGNGVCIPTDGCALDTDCAADHYCDGQSFTCLADLINGAATPLDHGACSQVSVLPIGTASAACRSGQCNAVTQTCSGPNAVAECTTAAECTSNICGADGHCGYADGTGTCDGTTGAVVCRSGACSASGICIPATQGSCWADGDCLTPKFCNRTAYTCDAPIASGQPLPNDGVHNTCSTSSPNPQCETGLCNAVTGTCASANGVTCSDPKACVSNACGNDGTCGYTNGEGTCSGSNEAVVCKGAKCGSDGKCGFAQGEGSCATSQECRNLACDNASKKCLACTADAQCAAGKYCSEANLCVDKLAEKIGCGRDAQCVSNRCSNGLCATTNPTTGGAAGQGGAGAGGTAGSRGASSPGGAAGRTDSEPAGYAGAAGASKGTSTDSGFDFASGCSMKGQSPQSSSTSAFLIALVGLASRRRRCRSVSS